VINQIRAFLLERGIAVRYPVQPLKVELLNRVLMATNFMVGRPPFQHRKRFDVTGLAYYR
jgi:hypothetical protein